MDYISDILLGIGAIAAACYCVILSKKLSRLSGLDQELGAAIAVLSTQVDDLSNVLKEAQVSAETTKNEIKEITQRAEVVAADLKAMQFDQVATGSSIIDRASNPSDETAIGQDGGLPDGPPSLFLRHARNGTWK